MKIFLDTSSLIKLYNKETDTYIVENIFIQNSITSIFLSEISKIEFISAIWKKVRTKEIAEEKAEIIIQLFEKSFGNYFFIKNDGVIFDHARTLLAKYGKQGLRALDSIQLSVAVSLVNEVDLFVTADKLLKAFFIQESLPT